MPAMDTLTGVYPQRKSRPGRDDDRSSNNYDKKGGSLRKGGDDNQKEETTRPERSSGSVDALAAEETLRQFDMAGRFGPCVGITRLERFERAHKLGLDPPQEVFDLLMTGAVSHNCLWEERV
eukprot:jgi/Chlat1/3347/Chrsp23S03656